MKRIFLIVFSIALIVLFAACSKDDNDAPPRNILAINNFTSTAAAGELVEIRGTGFSAEASENIITINGQNAEVAFASDTLLKVVVPYNAGNGGIAISVNGEKASSTQSFTYILTARVTPLSAKYGGYRDGPFAEALFSTPMGMCQDKLGNVLVADYANSRLRMISPAGMVSTITGRFVPMPLNRNGFYTPADVVIDSKGNIFVSESNAHVITKLTPSGEVSVFAGEHYVKGDVDGPPTVARFNIPGGMCVDAADNLYVADVYNHKVKKIDPGGNVTTIAGSSNSYADGFGTAAAFNHPMSVEIDDLNNLYVTDGGNHFIRKIEPSRQVTTMSSEPGKPARYMYPLEITRDHKGDFYFADSANSIIRMDPAGKFSSIGRYMNTATGRAFHFREIWGILAADDGSIIVTDIKHEQLFKVNHEF